MSKSEKLSFSLSSSKPKPPSSKPNPRFQEETHQNQSDPQPHYVTEFDASKTLAPSPKENTWNLQPQYITEFDASKTLTPSPQITVPPKENTWNLHMKKKMRNLDPSLQSEDEAALQFELENPSSNPDPTSSLSFGLNFRSKEDGDPKLSSPGRPSSLEEVARQKLREDLTNLPEDRGFDEFKDVPLEGFGAAVLAGYGWKEGQGLGRNKEDVPVQQYLRRAEGEGLGFVPELADRNQKRKRGGGHRSDPPLVAPVGPDGRTRHIVGIDEKLVPRELKGVFVGKVARVIDGRHAGLKGKVVEKLRSDFESQTVVLKLLKSGEEVRVGLKQVAEVGSLEEEKFLKELQELKSRGKDKRHGRREAYSAKKDDGKENGSKDKRRKKDEEWHRDRDGSGGCREDVRSPVSWLTSNIRVRIVSKEFKGGRLYLKKGEVRDVVSPTKCDISMDENKELIQGVDQEILETAIPKRGGPVLVLYGKHKGVFGNLVESDKERETGIVRDADTHALLNVRLEQIAEYIGDPSYLEY